MTDHSPTCALLVHHEPCTCHDTPETPTDRAARLALDLGRANRRIAELEAAEGRVRALHPYATIRGTVFGIGIPDSAWNCCVKCSCDWPCPTIAALDGPPDDQQDRKVPT